MQYLMILLACLAVCVPSVVRADAVDFDHQAITVALLQEPPNLDSTRTTDLVSFFVLGHVEEGLLRYDRRGHLAPGVARRWEVDDKTMVFHLRDNARWSDGSAVTAQDFVYAWRLINDPKTAAPYATIMYPIANAEAIQKGKRPVTDLGVQAVDDHTLKVTLASPCGYCLNLMVHAAFYPVKRAFREAQGEQYGAEPDKLLYNGPFMLTSWVHNSKLEMKKNPQYWNRDAIHLNEINVGYITEDNRTRLNLFRDGRIALARLGAETVQDAAAQGLRIRTFVSGGMAFLRFNMAAGHPTANKSLRQAMRLVFDPDVFVNKVIGIPGYRPAYSLFPSWINGAKGKFLEEHPPAAFHTDVDKARALLAQAKRQMGVDKLPPVTLLTVNSPTGARIAEYFQGLFADKLGLEVKVDQQSFKQYLAKSRGGRFDIALSSWYPDFDDIVTFADLLASYNPNNRGSYNNPAYDSVLEKVLKSPDPETRMSAAAQLQDIISEDVPVLPMAETGSAYVQNPKLKGVVRRVMGADPDYTFARVVN